MALTQVSTGGIKDGQISTSDLADGAISAAKFDTTALDHTYTLGASGTDHYTFTGEGLTGTVNDPTLYLTRGKTYRFVNGNSSGAHPFRIQSVAGAGGTEYNTGVTNNAGAGGSTIIFEVPHDAPDVLYYICTSHPAMNGIFYVTGALADGTVTTAKLADDAVDADKLANSINTAIAANTAKDLTALSATNLTSGTVPDARFPATLPVVSAANCTNIPAANITGTLPAISGANLTGISSAGVNRNLIINGDMQVAQRTSSSTTNGYASLDRFRNVYSNVDENVTQSQEDVAAGTTPYTLGFRKALRITNGNQTSGDNGDTNIQIWQRIESQYIANSGWNYVSSSSKVTLSFWVKSSVAQSFHCYLLNEDTTQHTFPFETGSLSADTWTKVTKTIPGSSNLVFNNDTGAGLRVAICPFLGSNKTANSLSNDTWVAYDGSNFTRDNTTTWLTTNDATFELTGVQLELGQTATDFEHLGYGDNLAKCQRYFYRLDTTFYGATWNPGHGGDGYGMISLDLKQTMRTSPTVTYGSMRTTSGLNTYTNPQRVGFYMNHDSPYGNDLKCDAEL